jgi:hypothetical protein
VPDVRHLSCAALNGRTMEVSGHYLVKVLSEHTLMRQALSTEHSSLAAPLRQVFMFILDTVFNQYSCLELRR